MLNRRQTVLPGRESLERSSPGKTLSVGQWRMETLPVTEKKLVALVVDNKVVSAPNVQAEITKESVLTGNTATGLTEEEVDRIMSIVR